MIADVQAWLNNPGNNFGWVLVGDEAANETAMRFDSRSNPDHSRRPELKVVFDPPNQQTGACCNPDGSCTIVADSSACTGVFQGLGTSCDPNPCTQPQGACCFPDAQATCSLLTEAECVAAGGSFGGDFTTCVETSCPVIPTPYTDPLPVPAPATPVAGTVGQVATYNLAMREVTQRLHSELPETTVWGYGDTSSGASYPGPTIEAFQGDSVTDNWINDLRDTSLPGTPLRTDHYLDVDLCPHGAENNAKAIVHLHGGHVPADVDGHPDLAYTPGNLVSYKYPNNQEAAALWYHDHALGITRLNVYMGLAGFYLIRDPNEQNLGLPSGSYELPLVIQDRSFNVDGSFYYPSDWQDMFFGKTILVNGGVWPYHNVDRGKYRLRILNGSGSRMLTLQFCPNDNESPCTSPADFQLIAHEGGFLPAPVTLNEMTLAPGERRDVVVDFFNYDPGTAVYLVNSAPAPYPGPPGEGVVPDVMKFVIGSNTGHTDQVPGDLHPGSPMEVLSESDAAVHRYFELEKGPGNACSPFAWEIVSTDGLNGPVLGRRWNDISELPKLGDTEVWSFINRSGMFHPMHMHLVFFQVLDREQFSEVDGLVVPSGVRVSPSPGESGWKDTVQVNSREIVRVIARFEDYSGLFPYHCHILEHEDHEMMRQFKVVGEIKPKTMPGIPLLLLDD